MDIAEVPLIDGASQRFNLAMQDIINQHEDAVKNVHQIMTKLRDLKCTAHLRILTGLKPITLKNTHFSSTLQMIKRYIELIAKLKQLNMDESNNLLPSIAEDIAITKLLDKLKLIESVNKKLEENGTKIADTRALFDVVKLKYPQTKSRLSYGVKIVYNPHFEMVIVKIQERRCYELSAEKWKNISNLLR